MTDVHINFTFSDPETAAAFAANFSQGAAALVSMLGTDAGRAAATHRQRAARAPKAVADAPAGETTKELRAWYREYLDAGYPEEVVNGKTIGFTGTLSKDARARLIEMRAEHAAVEDDAAEGEAGADLVGAVIDGVSSERPVEEPVTTGRRKFGKGRRDSSG